MKKVMSAKLKAAARLALLRVGRHVSSVQLDGLRSVLSDLELGHWLHSEYTEFSPESAASKFALSRSRASASPDMHPYTWSSACSKVGQCAGGHNTCPSPPPPWLAFDSFEGLPEDWRHGKGSGHFRTGEPPRINDSRVSFQVGWFDNTLPRSTVPDHGQPIINVDSDLYSSARTVLAMG